MFSSDPVKNIAFRIILTATVIHGIGLTGIIGGSLIRHIVGLVGALIFNLWMIHGSSKYPWIMNIAGTGVGALVFLIGGFGMFSKSILVGLSMLVIAVVLGDLCRRLCSKEVSANIM